MTGEGKDLEHLGMENTLRLVLGNYDLGELRSVQPVGPGFVNENWILETTHGQYFLKRRHPDLRNPDIIRAQHKLVDHLQQAGFPAPVIMPATSGETFLVVDGEFYEIQEHIVGAHYKHTNAAHFQEAAVCLGHYHACIRGFAPQSLCDLGDLYSPAIITTNLANLIEAWELHGDPTLVRTCKQLESITADLAALFAEHQELPCVVIHGDYHADNLLFEGDRIAAVVDYDKACWQPRVVELAEALIYFASTRPGHLKHLVYPSFLDWDKFTTFMCHYGTVFSSPAKELVQYPKVPEPDSSSDLARHFADNILKASEVHALPDYICCIWLSVSLQRLLEMGSRPAFAAAALGEVLELGKWATTNRERLIATTYSAIGKPS